jgi:hypothetical protein
MIDDSRSDPNGTDLRLNSIVRTAVLNGWLSQRNFALVYAKARIGARDWERGVVVQFECGTRILRVIHGRDARATSPNCTTTGARRRTVLITRDSIGERHG